jgi:outer membrane lipoprotein carrier protein
MTAGQLAGKLQNSYDKTRDLRADFRQVSVVKAMDMTKEASGTLLIKKPGMLRYTYDKPEKQEIIVRGDDLIMYIPSQNQVIKKTLSRELMDKTPTTFLGGLGKITDSFEPKIPAGGEKDKQGRYVLELIPKGEKMGVEEITLALDPKTFDIREFSFRDASGNVNTISLGNIKINKGVKDSAFNFKIPKGASLISE